MTALKDNVHLDERALERAVKWYADHDVPARFRDLDPRVVRKARRLAHNDWARCTVDEAGWITVWNHPVWRPVGRK